MIGFFELKSDNKKSRVFLFVVFGLLLFLPSVWILIHRMEGNNPEILLEFPSPYIGLATEYSGKVMDPGSGVRKVWVGLIKDGKEHILQDEAFPSLSFFSGGAVKEAPITLKIDPQKLNIGDGKAVLRIAAWDYSWRNWYNGNQAYLEKEFIIDTKPPEIDMLTKAHNISQGGAGLVIYRISEKDSQTGVTVGKNFFPGISGYFRDDSIHMAFVALDHLQDLNTQLFVKATDRAGNISQAGFTYYLKKGNFRNDKIDIPDRFLNWKMPEFAVTGPNGGPVSGIEKFLVVNQQLRRENTELFIRISKKTTPEILWEGAFLRLPQSATRAKFADRRSYHYKDKVVDHQYHMGIDLAATAHSPIPAANNGRVVFTGDNGIYGKTVILDHGFGLFSLYSHLSRINVQMNDMMKKGDILGLSGTTGMAGGDHLHYGMMIHNTFVNPLEWWDDVWINHNVTSKINDVRDGEK
ncbi:MAG: M23 family metallopeptidase [Desulfobacteraceae bacterium]|nr:MAG: M23 family metallopeptidase [Desulfobacteraceae bacterium]